MKFLAIAILSFSVSLAHAQMSESEISDMCMNQIVAGMVQDNVVGPASGICVKFIKDPNGNVTGMDFKMNSSAFALGKDQLGKNPQDAQEQKDRIKVIKDFVLSYQKIATKNNDIKIDDIDVQVRSYADGVGGPTTYDKEISEMKTWGDLLNYIGDDKAGVKYISELVPQSKRPGNEVKFTSLPKSAQSAIRNIVLGKRRSETICKEFGISDCEKRNNAGFSSPDLEKRTQGRECADRRVSVIKVNLTKAVEINGVQKGEFHPKFTIPHSEEGEQLKADMQIAASFDAARRHNESREKYKDAALRERLSKEALAKAQRSTNGIERAAASKIHLALNGYSKNEFSILDLPEAVQKSPDVSFYANQMTALNTKYTAFKNQIAVSFPQLKSYVEEGDFIGFKEEADKITNPTQKSKLLGLQSSLTNYGSSNPDTDIFNYLSTSDALQYHFIKNPNSPNLTNASTVVNQSNADLKITLGNDDLEAARRPKTGPHATAANNKDDGRAHWQCYGGCGTGIHERPNGEIVTNFRDAAIKEKTAAQMNKEFGEVPTGFGALKSLNVYVIKDCSNCDCLKQKGARLDDILQGSNVTKVSIDQVTKDATGKRSASKPVGTLEDPFSTCIFTPPVAHTCKVDPKGTNPGHAKAAPETNYGCAMWDKSSHGLKWTANFLKEGLEIAETSDQAACEVKAQPLREVAQSAVCDQGDPAPVPDSCK